MSRIEVIEKIKSRLLLKRLKIREKVKMEMDTGKRMMSAKFLA